MKRNIISVLKLILFWLLLFALQHTIFLLYNHNELGGIGFGMIMKSYWFALSMDISSSCYLIFIPVLLVFIASFFSKNRRLLKIIHVYTIVMIVICCLVSIFDIGLYSAWGTKINGKAISYMLYPREAMQSFSSVPYVLLLSMAAIEIFIAIYFYRRWVRMKQLEKANPFLLILAFVVSAFLLLTGIRGGFQKYPLNKGWVYYSKFPVLNYSALNGFWNFMEIFVNPGIKNNPYKYFTDDEADAIVKKMYEIRSDSTEKILKTDRPNIILILLESVSAECSEKLGGIKGLMPGFDSLCSEGLLFKNFYATGFRTEQGLISYLSCFPAQPKTTIMRQFGKFEKLPNFARLLDDNGYTLNYYYSGKLEFANTEPYLASSGFSKIIGKDEHAWKRTTEWGAYDDELFQYHLDNANKDSVPFFSVVMTSTSHEAFDADVPKVYTGNSEAEYYKNTVHYTDQCLSDYLKKAKEKPWYTNTLFIITADHAHSYPYSREANEIERHWIPLLFCGDVLNDEYKGKTIAAVGSQTDLAATLLAQMHIGYKSLKRSTDLLNNSSYHFAFYTYDNGFGFITSEQSIVFDADMNEVVYKKNNADTAVDARVLKEGKAYLQQMFEEYIELNQ